MNKVESKPRGRSWTNAPAPVVCKHCGSLLTAGKDGEHQCLPEAAGKGKLRLPIMALFATVALSVICFIALNSDKQAPVNKYEAGNAPAVQGQWQIRMFANSQCFPGFMQLKQNGSHLIGSGKDEAGTFALAGRLKSPRQLTLEKKYDQESCRRGAHSQPIEMTAVLQNTPQGMLMRAGQYRTQVKSGFSQSYFHRTHWTTVTGSWSARRVSDTVSDAMLQNRQLRTAFINPLKALDAQPIEPAKQAAPWIDQTSLFFCLWGGAGLLFAILLWYINVRIFGTDGLASRSEVARYIPSQLKSEHDKMLKQFGRPAGPGGITLGKRVEWRPWCFWKAREIAIPQAVRAENPHMLVIGSSGKGKTRLMASMVAQDIRSSDRAVMIVDSCGELSRLLSGWLAESGKEYASKVVMIDPTRKTRISYNPLALEDGGDLQAAASAVVRGFKSIYAESPGRQSKWNQQTANILRNAAMLLMLNKRTLADLPALLTDNDFRDLMLTELQSSKSRSEATECITLSETWSQYKRLARGDQWIEWVEPILNQLSPMLSNESLRSIVNLEYEAELDLKKIIRQKKILVVKIPKGELGQTGNLFGSLLVTGLQQAALNLLSAGGARKSRPVSLYIDELDNLVDKETISAICSETSRYQIAFVAALKTLQYIPEDFRHKLLISVGTIAAFSLVRKDGELFGPQMFRVDGRKFRHQHMQMFTDRMNIPNPEKAFHLITDEEKLNVDRVVAQKAQQFFCYRVGTTAGVFSVKAHNFDSAANCRTRRVERPGFFQRHREFCNRDSHTGG